MSSARKPVIVRQLTREWYGGYAAAYPDAKSSELELLDSSGKLVRIALERVKWVCYVRELGREFGRELVTGLGSASDADSPERLLKRRFAGRPRMTGVWLRLTLADGDELEGVTGNDCSLVAGPGLLLTPPDTRSNTQRVFVPRSSIRELTILGVMLPKPDRDDEAALQPELFGSQDRSLEST